MLDRKSIVFRVDASLDIGTGHVMRCLTFARALRDKGFFCTFICRAHKGNLIEYITNSGFFVFVLKTKESLLSNTGLKHAAWLGDTQEKDFDQSLSYLEKVQPVGVVVDHYGIDALWESKARKYCSWLFVIDDLADRTHKCDFFLDQNLGRSALDYRGLLSLDCKTFYGVEFALLRPEFGLFREASLRRRALPSLNSIFLNMGGVDKDNMTGKVLDTLSKLPEMEGRAINVVMGGTAPWREEIQRWSSSTFFDVSIKTNVSNMAELMTECDLAIGAAGATSWERCCLGMPSVLITQAFNQRVVGEALSAAGAAFLIDSGADIDRSLPVFIKKILSNLSVLSTMSSAASALTNGRGASRLAGCVEALSL